MTSTVNGTTSYILGQVAQVNSISVLSARLENKNLSKKFVSSFLRATGFIRAVVFRLQTEPSDRAQ